MKLRQKQLTHASIPMKGVYHFRCRSPIRTVSWWHDWTSPGDGWISSGASSSMLDTRIGELFYWIGP